MTVRDGGLEAQERGEDEEIERDAEKGEAGNEQAGDGAGAEGEAQAVGRALLVAACAVRTLARTETFMPMKPAAPESTAPMAKPIA